MNGPHVVDAAKVAEFEQWGAVAVGRDVYVGDTHVQWDGDITAMYYTSQGVVVRSDGDYSLIRADGEVSSISVAIPDRVPGFEPDSTRFAYVDGRGDDRWEVVVHDAASDRELSRTEIGGRPYGGWTARPAAIDGDLAWVHLRDRWVEVDWRTGAVRDVPGTSDTFEVANGVYAVQAGPYAERRSGAWEVRAPGRAAIWSAPPTCLATGTRSSLPMVASCVPSTRVHAMTNRPTGSMTRRPGRAVPSMLPTSAGHRTATC